MTNVVTILAKLHKKTVMPKNTLLIKYATEPVATPTPQNKLDTYKPKHKTKANSLAPAKRKQTSRQNKPNPFANCFLKWILFFCINTCPLLKNMLSSLYFRNLAKKVVFCTKGA